MTVPPGRPATVVIIDDHPVFRRGLADLLADDGFDVVGQASTVAEGIAAVQQAQPDVVVMDLHLPDGSGVAATRRIVDAGTQTRVLVLTMDGSDAAVLAALRAGARGYLLKETAAESIGRTVAAMARGELVVDGRLADRVARLLTRPAGGDPREDDAPPGHDLTDRERQVLGLVAQGRSNVEIARQLFLAEKTIRNNVTALLAKTGQPSRPALIAWARDQGF